MTLSKELDEMVKPGMRENWEREKPQWFVLDDSIDQLREPGKKFFYFLFRSYFNVFKAC